MMSRFFPVTRGLIFMTTITEIEKAIEELPTRQVDELAEWLQAYRSRALAAQPPDNAIEGWLNRARGAAMPGVTTVAVMALTRGEE